MPDQRNLKLLVIEGNTKIARDAARGAGLPTQGELYITTLEKLSPGVVCETVYPADPDSQLPAGARLEEYDGIVWTGSSLNVYDRTPEIERQIELMRICFERETVMFGSCWGLQVAAVAADGEVSANSHGREIGIARNISLTPAGADHPMYADKGQIFDSVAIHLDHVTRLPKGAVVLATNGMSAIQAFELRRGKSLFWGVQYHPEFDLPYIAGLMRRYTKMMIAEGFCRDEGDVLALTGDLAAAARDEDRPDLRWRYGLGDDVLKDSRRLTEISNWLKSLKT